MFLFSVSHAVGKNDDMYQWIAYSDWIYEARFDLTDTDINNRQFFLKCDGLDTAATVKSVKSIKNYLTIHGILADSMV